MTVSPPLVSRPNAVAVTGALILMLLTGRLCTVLQLLKSVSLCMSRWNRPALALPLCRTDSPRRMSGRLIRAIWDALQAMATGRRFPYRGWKTVPSIRCTVMPPFCVAYKPNGPPH